MLENNSKFIDEFLNPKLDDINEEIKRQEDKREIIEERQESLDVMNPFDRMWLTENGYIQKSDNHALHVSLELDQDKSGLNWSVNDELQRIR